MFCVVVNEFTDYALQHCGGEHNRNDSRSDSRNGVRNDSRNDNLNY